MTTPGSDDCPPDLTTALRTSQLSFRSHDFPSDLTMIPGSDNCPPDLTTVLRISQLSFRSHDFPSDLTTIPGSDDRPTDLTYICTPDLTPVLHISRLSGSTNCPPADCFSPCQLCDWLLGGVHFSPPVSEFCQNLFVKRADMDIPPHLGPPS